MQTDGRWSIERHTLQAQVLDREFPKSRNGALVRLEWWWGVQPAYAARHSKASIAGTTIAESGSCDTLRKEQRTTYTPTGTGTK
eukprot:942707-Amphidinium_carterae.1